MQNVCMRRDPHRLHDILDALDSIAAMIQGRTESDFVNDETLCYAVAHRLTVAGEAAGRVSPEIRERNPDVPWADIIALRNILVHEYFGVHWPLVWKTVSEHAPLLRVQIAEILQSEFRE